MKSIKNIVVTAIPSFAMLALQIIVMYGLMIIEAVIDNVRGNVGVEGIDEYISALVTDSHFNSLYMICYETIAILCFGLFFGLKYVPKDKTDRKKLSVLSFPGIVLLFIGTEMVLSCILIFLNLIIPDIMSAYGQMMQSTMGDMNWMIMTAAIVLAPIAEEIIFRGITLRLAEKVTGKFWVANIIQAVFFGFVHLNLVQGVYAFLLGLLLGYVRRIYNTLYASMLGHIVFNFAGTVLVNIIFGINIAHPIFYVVTIMILAIAVIVGASFIIHNDEKGFEGTNEFDIRHAEIYFKE